MHMFRGLYYGSYKAPRERCCGFWVVVIYVLMIATAFLGYTLPWGQMSFWGATGYHRLSSRRSASDRRRDPSLDSRRFRRRLTMPTLNRFFSLHYLLPFVIAGVDGAARMGTARIRGQNNPTGVDGEGRRQDTVAFTPYAYYTAKDAVGLGHLPSSCSQRSLFFYAASYLGHTGQLHSG